MLARHDPRAPKQQGQGLHVQGDRVGELFVAWRRLDLKVTIYKSANLLRLKLDREKESKLGKMPHNTLKSNLHIQDTIMVSQYKQEQ